LIRNKDPQIQENAHNHVKPPPETDPLWAHKPLEINIHTDNAQEFLETHNLSFKKGDFIITPTHPEQEQPPTYAKISLMNLTQSRNPEIPYLHLGVSAPDSPKQTRL
jgi:hypothetical protein